jgi:hypothetical protein
MSRVRVNTDNQVLRAPNKGEKHSEFLITINPNKTFFSSSTPEYQQMIDKLTKLGDFLLEKQNIVKMLKFLDPEGESHSKEWHMTMISEIDPMRSATIEWGAKKHNLHIHVTYWIKHFTYLQLNRSAFEKVVSAILGQPIGSFHINFRVHRMMGFKDYINKYSTD